MNNDKEEVNEFNPDDNVSPAEYNPYDDVAPFKRNSYDGFEPEENDENKKEHPVSESSQNSATEGTDIAEVNDYIDMPDFMNVGMEDKSTEPLNFENEDSPQTGSHYIERNSAKMFSQNNEKKQESVNEDSDNDLNKNENPYGNNGFSHNSEQEKPFSTQNQQQFNNPVEEENKQTGGNTEDVKEEIGFKSKISAEEADKAPKSKPKVLNKRFILTILICVFGITLLVTFLMPTGKGKKEKNEKPVAETHRSTDYASLAKKQPAEGTYKHYEDKNVKDVKNDYDDKVEIPPVIVKEEKQSYNDYSSGKGSGGSSSTIEIPDTRNDSLQGKHISGIKGLSSSQQKYSTDYQETIEKNVRSTQLTSTYTMPSKEEYMNNVLSAYTQAYGNATSGNNDYAVQNDQAGKNSFYTKGRDADNVGQGEWLNLNTLWQGTIFEATLTSELNTDLPGEITARIAKNIYSSQDGRYLLIPQNSILYGTYNSSISYSQNRVQVGWHTLVRPDGYQIQLGNMNATDAKGASGLKGFVNDHPMAYLKAIGLMSVFSIVNSEFNAQMGQTQNQYVQNVIANTQQVTNELADKLIDRAMNVQPTIKIKAGTKINIVVNQNLSLPPCEEVPVTQQYQKKK